MVDVSRSGRHHHHNHHHHHSSATTTPASSPSVSSTPAGGGGHVRSPSPNNKNMPSSSSTSSYSYSSAPVYISHRFKHFVQMLWTCSRVDTIIKNYALAWVASSMPSSSSQLGGGGGGEPPPSRNLVTARFGEECVDFSRLLYKLFVHAAGHIHASLNGHLHDPMFARAAISTTQSPSPLQPPRSTSQQFMVLSAAGAEDVSMQDADAFVSGTILR